MVFPQRQPVLIESYPDVAGYSFGPITTVGADYLLAAPGVFVCMYRGTDMRRYLFDVDQAENLRWAVAHHPRMACWRRATSAGQMMEVGTYIAALDMRGREEVVRRIRAKYPQMLCG